MSAMDREGPSHASRPAGSEELTLLQLETTFEAALSDKLILDARLEELEQTWFQRKPRLPDVLLTTRADAPFDLCHDNEIGYYYTVRDIPALYEAARAAPHLWPHVQAIVTALQHSRRDAAQLADEIGLTAAYQESASRYQAVVDAVNAILQQPAHSMAVLASKARLLACSHGLKPDQDPWRTGSFKDRTILVLLQDLLAASPAREANAC